MTNFNFFYVHHKITRPLKQGNIQHKKSYAEMAKQAEKISLGPEKLFLNRTRQSPKKRMGGRGSGIIILIEKSC